MANAQNIKIGACRAFYKGVDLGHTYGGVTLNYSPEFADLKADQWGETPFDKALNGEVMTAVVRLAESSVEAFKNAIPMGELVGANDGRLTIGSNAGKRLATEAGVLVLHPLANDDDDASEDVVLYKAVAMDEFEVEYNNEDQRILEITFVALVDTTKANGSWLGHIGDSTD